MAAESNQPGHPRPPALVLSMCILFVELTLCLTGSAIGEGSLDLDDAAGAAKAFAAALNDARVKGGDPAVLARALGGAGRAQARLGKHGEALQHFTERLPVTSDSDRAWVLHEVG